MDACCNKRSLVTKFLAFSQKFVILNLDEVTIKQNMWAIAKFRK